MEETAPSKLLAQEGLPPPAQDRVGQANCTGSVKESQAIDQLKYSQKKKKLPVYKLALLCEKARLEMYTNSL